MTLGTKLVSAFLGCGLIPLGIVAFMSYRTADKSMQTISQKGETGLEQGAYNQLVALRDVKKDQVEKYFARCEGDMSALVETVNTIRAEAFNKLTAVREIKKMQIEDYFNKALLEMEIFARSQDVHRLYVDLAAYHKAMNTPADGPYDVTTPEYKKIWEEDGKNLFQYYKESGVYDVFLICADHGHVMYTAAKESDLGSNLAHGPYKDSGLAKLWRKVKEKDASAVVDFEPYAPSNGDPACFCGTPIRDDSGQMIGMMVVQLPLDQVNAIMTAREGLGRTGETYLVGQDQLMRSDSFLDPENHSVQASFADPSKGSVNTEASKSACAGETAARVILDYNGNPVLSAWTPVKFADLTWGLLAEMDVAEAFAPHVEGEEKDFFTKYNDQRGYYDLFLINNNGYCYYTVCHEADYQTNFVDGKYKDSNLGNLVRRVLETRQFGFADFEPYAPSDNEPCAFIAQPVVNAGKVEAVVALQLPLDQINQIMGLRSGLGETGETYLIGPDKLMRSDSFLDPTHHTVKASFADPSKGKVDTEAARDALAGKPDAKLITDYNGNPVLSAYCPVNVCGTTWALLAEIDEAEALAAAKDMRSTSDAATATLLTWNVSLGVVATIVVVIVSVVVARSISKPINRIIAGLNEGADQVNDAAGQVSTASQQLAEGASEQAASLEETSSALEEMAAMTRQNASNAKEANGLAGQAREAANEGDRSMVQLNTAMTGINESSEKISKIIKVIEEIAFQTNLLALNAAVEAARAGEHGKGFAVVADEVRNLAQRAAQAAGETTSLIEDAVRRAKEGTQVAGDVGKTLGGIVGQVAKVSDLIDGISKASEEQAQGVDQVTTAVGQMDKVTQQNASGAEESASAAEELAAQSQAVKGMVDELVGLVNGTTGRSGSATAGVTRRPRKAKPATPAKPTKPRPRKEPTGDEWNDDSASADKACADNESESMAEF